MSLLPDWNYLQMERHSFLGIVCLILLAVAEIGSHIYGSRSSFLIGEAARLAGLQRIADETAAKKQSDAEASQLRERLAEAQAVVAAAKANADELRRRAEPRHLGDGEKAVIGRMLAGQPKGKLVIKASASVQDARAFLSLSGWGKLQIAGAVPMHTQS